MKNIDDLTDADIPAVLTGNPGDDNVEGSPPLLMRKNYLDRIAPLEQGSALGNHVAWHVAMNVLRAMELAQIEFDKMMEQSLKEAGL